MQAMKDSDECLRKSSWDWGPDSSCRTSAKHCDTWAKDMKRCCPETCKVADKFTNSDCQKLGVDIKGRCKYPFKTEPHECKTSEIKGKSQLCFFRNYLYF